MLKETRRTLILAGSLTLIGSCVKDFAVEPGKFYLVLTGQVFSALGLVFTYSLIGRFSAAWFSADEISRAGALSCVGDIVRMNELLIFLYLKYTNTQKLLFSSEVRWDFYYPLDLFPIAGMMKKLQKECS